MSKIGKKPVIIPSGINVSINNGIVIVEGQKGKLEMDYHPSVNIAIVGAEIIFSVNSQNDRNLRGLTRTLVQNLVQGINETFTKKLLVLGVGYTAKLLNPHELELSLGYSHKIYFNVPKSINVFMEKDSKGSDIIILNSIDKQLLGQISSDIRNLRKPEPYKGKGIRYIDEIVKLKAGKAAKK